MSGSGNAACPGVQNKGSGIGRLGLALPSCVTLDESLCLSELHCPQPEDGDNETRLGGF